MKSYYPLILLGALFSGMVLVLGFAPFDQHWTLLLSPLLLFVFLQKQTPTRAMWVGFTFGLGFFGAGVSWVFISIYVFGDTPIWLAFIITTLFICALASMFAILGYALQKLYPKNTLGKLLIVYPALWALLEAFRSWLFTGFPWLLLGHSLAGSQFGGWIPIFGVYGTSYLAVMTAGLFLIAGTPFWNAKHSYHWVTSNVAVLGVMVLLLGASLLMFIHWTQPTGKTLTVSLMQGNIKQSLRWDPQEVDHILKTYTGMTLNHLDSQLLVWPEAAIPLVPEEAQPLLEPLNKLLLAHHSALLTGIPIRQGINYYNSVIALGNASGVYEKRHLVPFGEYVPFEKWLRGLIGFFNLPMSNFVAPGAPESLLVAQGIPVAMFICYEVAYDEIVRSDLPQAQLLGTVSDDAWFGHSLAPWQHLQITQFQALATGRQALVVGNTGLTGIVDEQGNLQSFIPGYQQLVLTGKVQAFTGSTPWVLLGDWPWLSLMFVGLLYVYWKHRRA